MKSKVRIISILLIVQLMLASVAFSVYAAGEDVQGDVQNTEQVDLATDNADSEGVNTSVSEQNADGSEAADSAEKIDGAVQSEGTKVEETTVAAPTVTISETTATVKWEEDVAVTEAKMYKYDTDWVLSESKVIAAEEKSVDFTNLEMDTKYGFTVTTADGESLKTEKTIVKNLSVPKSFEAFPSYKSVFLVWEPVAGAESYEVYKGSSLFKKIAESKLEKRTASDGTEYLIWFDKDNKKDKTYKYKIKAVAGNAQSEFTDVKKAARIRTAYYKCKFKASVRLYSHDSAKKGVTFKKGQTITAEGYGTGAYEFNYKGHPYEAKWFRMGKTKSDYSKNAYNKKYHGDYIVAENYVNRSNGGKSYSSKTGNLTWISLYSQRIFVFEGKKGKWRLIKSWQCNSGKASSPTPTGFKKDIWKTFTRHSSHKYWSCFSSFNAIHGRNSNDAALGKPVSNGCVRTNNDDAQWFMKLNNKKLHAKVLSW